MAILQFESNDTSLIEIMVQESDIYTRATLLRLSRHIIPENIYGVNEIFISPSELKQLGHFLMEEANAIEAKQQERYK